MNADQAKRIFMWGAICGAGLCALITTVVTLLAGRCS